MAHTHSRRGPCFSSELPDLQTGVIVRETGQRGQRVPHGQLFFFIQIWPAIPAHKKEHTVRPASHEDLGNPPELLRRLSETRPYIPPAPPPLGEFGSGLHI